MLKSSLRRPALGLLLALAASVFLFRVGHAQVVPVDHEEFLSGGALDPVLDVTAGPESPTGTGRPPRVGPNRRANGAQAFFPAGLVGRSETSIASTDDGQLAVSGWNDAQGFCGAPFGNACTPQSPPGLSGYASSTDGGLTWTDGGAPPVIDHIFTRGDPWLDRGGLDGSTFYYANLAVHDQTGATLGISVHRGHFGGGSFAWEDAQTFDSPRNAATPGADFYDKEAIAAAKDGSGAAYVSVTNFQELCGNPQFGFGQIEVWRTHDGGATWEGPAIAGPEAADSVAACGVTGTLQQSSVPAVGPDGEVYVVWQFGPTFSPATSLNAQIRLARSLDGGATFDPSVKVADINSMRQNPPVGYSRGRINDHPRIAVATSGPNRGRIYVTFYSAVSPTAAGQTVQNLTSSQAFVSHSDDKGASWSAPVPIAPAVPSTGVKRFWPVVNVEPGGNVDVVYYESRETQATANPTDIECSVSISRVLRRRGVNSSLVDTFWAQSTDGGATFNAPLKVSTATSNWCTAASNIRPNFGDYIGASVGGNRILAAWADSRNGVVDSFYAQILGAGKSQ